MQFGKFIGVLSAHVLTAQEAVYVFLVTVTSRSSLATVAVIMVNVISVPKPPALALGQV